MKLPDWHKHFLGLTNQDLGLASQHIQGLVYGPGLVCMRCNSDLSAGVVLKPGQSLELWGQDCAYGYAPDQWFKAIHIGQYYLTHQQLLTDQALNPRQRGALRGLELYLQLNPTHKFARGMRNLLMDGKVLSAAQASLVEGFCAEMDGLPAMLVARNQMRRLSILGALPMLLPEDESPVASLLRQLLRLEYLSEKQNRLIYALQDKYVSAVLTYTSQLLRAWPPIGGWLWKLE